MVMQSEINVIEDKAFRTKRRGYNLRQMIHYIIRSFQVEGEMVRIFDVQDIWKMTWAGDSEKQMKYYLRIMGQIQQYLKPDNLGGPERTQRFLTDAWWTQFQKLTTKCL